MSIPVETKWRIVAAIQSNKDKIEAAILANTPQAPTL
jgi:hypothetical protein